ncbi:MAG: tRNA pseudouridine(38-40) synthase TruA [Deltaproteobacteria bacterium RIFCSPHIGHO2_02_FULL_40_11]|nr:MAG: tRNA pseudouridine(38-40) synthase TruA [Deltaproteobacteria bacterium RIFCSPHIGHO2_02_FULL_40_11]
MMLRNLKFTIEYDGTRYFGWQRQIQTPTLQQTLEETLEKIIQKKVHLVASGRTDRGVHALAQIAHLKLDTHLTNTQLQKGLNALLPADIKIKEIETVSENFHAQLHAKSKIYRYQIYNFPTASAVYRNQSCWISHPLNIELMKQAANLIIGEHDFKAFQNAGTQVPSTIRKIYRSEIYEKPPFLIYEVEGNGFLKQMVRNIVSALCEVGKSRLSIDAFETLLKSKNRRLGPKSAPPQGLFLVEVFH